MAKGQHRLSGIGEDRNIPISSPLVASTAQHQPFGVGEDRNTAKWLDFGSPERKRYRSFGSVRIASGK